MKEQFYGVWVDDRGAVKVGSPRATEEAARTAAEKDAGRAQVVVVVADSAAGARLAHSTTALVEPTQEEIDEARGDEPPLFFFPGGLTADGEAVIGEIGHTLSDEAIEDAESNPLFVAGTVCAVQARDGEEALAALRAAGGVMPQGGVIVAAEVKRSARVRADAMSQEEIEAVAVPEGRTMFIVAASGMLYLPRYNPRGGVVDVFFSETPHMAELGPAKDAGQLTGSLRGVKIRDLHGASCRATEPEYVPANRPLEAGELQGLRDLLP